jgi:hypothetical protein
LTFGRRSGRGDSCAKSRSDGALLGDTRMGYRDLQNPYLRQFGVECRS